MDDRTSSRRRVDTLLVERGFFESRARAQAAIASGLVSAGGRTVRKGADLVDANAAIEASAPHPWVSRGGIKLAAALDGFGLDPRGLVCLDVGASTGGFTDVLLARGARRVYAVDVGRGQLHPRIAADPRVVSLEGVDARALDEAAMPEPADLLVADVSFISLKLVLPAAVRRLAARAALAALIKPQFEAGRKHLKKGIVRDAAVREAVRDDLHAFVAGLGFEVAGVVPSPVAGGDGNVEYLIGARRG
jgi:23S rRNA (cytidine1920-2'-O)/16S rRNA (cytidine1409-2'-O)-methyltransferase